MVREAVRQARAEQRETERRQREEDKRRERKTARRNKYKQSPDDPLIVWAIEGNPALTTCPP